MRRVRSGTGRCRGRSSLKTAALSIVNHNNQTHYSVSATRGTPDRMWEKQRVNAMLVPQARTKTPTAPRIARAAPSARIRRLWPQMVTQHVQYAPRDNMRQRQVRSAMYVQRTLLRRPGAGRSQTACATWAIQARTAGRVSLVSPARTRTRTALRIAQAVR